MPQSFKLQAGSEFTSCSSKKKIKVLKVTLSTVQIQRTGQQPEAVPFQTALYNIKNKLWL